MGTVSRATEKNLVVLQQEASPQQVSSTIHELMCLAYKKWAGCLNGDYPFVDRECYWLIYTKLRDGKMLTREDLFFLGAQ